MKRILGTLVLMMVVFSLVGCNELFSDASIASANLSTDADNFKIYRRVIFYNGITDKYIMSVEGYCSINVDSMDNQLELTVKDGGAFKKHYLGLSDNVTYFVEQIDPALVSDGRYKVIFKPSVIVPYIEVR